VFVCEFLGVIWRTEVPSDSLETLSEPASALAIRVLERMHRKALKKESRFASLQPEARIDPLVVAEYVAWRRRPCGQRRTLSGSDPAQSGEAALLRQDHVRQTGKYAPARDTA
jgi:hypothetical protein